MNRTLFDSPTGSQGKVVFLGLPFDHGSEAPSGCQMGPMIIRSLSSSFSITHKQLYDTLTQKPFLQTGDLSDLGDLEYRVQYGVKRFLENLESITTALVHQDTPFFYLGGDHLATLGSIRGIARALDAFQILHIDAHTDFRPLDDNDCPTHANFMYLTEQLPQVKKIFQWGLRGFDAVSQSPSDKRHLLSAGLSELEAMKVQLDPALPVFITIDTDAFDPLEMPAVNFPVPQGLPISILKKLFQVLEQKKVKILGCDWMEYNPDMDSKNKICGHLILHEMAQIIQFLVKQTVGKNSK